MDLINKHNLNFKLVLPLSIGFIAFFFITGGKILSPTTIGWLMEGDPATHWLGWQFFRNSPILQWPLGANPNYGIEISSSVVFTDSIPLLALIFKPFSGFLPNAFQYIGLWVLLCFLLQSFFSWKLLSIFTQNKWLPLIGCGFFAVAPTFLSRLQGHYALFGQWTILAGFYLYFSKHYSTVRWLCLLSISALIHPYLLAMVVAIWIADLYQRKLLIQSSSFTTLVRFFAGIAWIAIIMWAAGYFMLSGGLGSGGFGFYRMNLLSLVDPDSNGSNFLRDQLDAGGDYEGFNYLGIGMIGLLIIALSTLFSRGPLPSYQKMLPIIILFICLSLYAISNKVAIGQHEIFTYSMPAIAKHITNTFRASGRFFWPAYYILYLVIFYFIFTRLKPIAAIVICISMLLLQVVDYRHIYKDFKNKFTTTLIYQTPMSSPLWEDIAGRYKSIIYVLPHNAPPNWMELSYFAASHQMKINVGYFARVDPKNLDEARTQLSALIIKGSLSPDSIYVFQDVLLWNLAVSSLSPLDIAGRLDGLKIVAPNLKKCEECNLSLIDQGN